MVSLLIAVIYLAFVSMGLPDALLGSVWPTIYVDMEVPVSFAGLVTILIASGTVISSLLSNRMIRRFGTGIITVACTALTVVALFGFSLSSRFWHLCIWALPYGLGAGSIDAALNNYVALHYKSRHMSWIHFFWGLGATAGPYVMGACLSRGLAWTMGYRFVAIAQLAMTVCLLFTLPLWKKNPAEENIGARAAVVTAGQVLRMPGAKAILIAFFGYCSLEATAGLWASSYMAIVKGVDAASAAMWTSLYYLGITAGRFLNGFITDRVGDRNMIRIGLGLAALGAVAILLPFGRAFAFAGLVLVGLGCAPIFPCLLHETPANFGAENSQAIMGIQMACAYTGSTLMPPLLGVLAERVNISLYPAFLLFFVVLMTVMVERLNRAVSAKQSR